MTRNTIFGPQVPATRTPNEGYGPRAVHRDPRRFGRAFDPQFPGDQWVQEDQRNARILRLSSGLVNSQEPNAGRVQQAPFLIAIAAVNKPVQLLPKNSARKTLIVINPGPLPALPATQLVWLSFGAPVQTGANTWLGIPLTAGGQPYSEISGDVSINDIWAVCGDAQATYPFFVGCFEGSPSIFG